MASAGTPSQPAAAAAATEPLPNTLLKVAAGVGAAALLFRGGQLLWRQYVVRWRGGGGGEAGESEEDRFTAEVMLPTRTANFTVLFVRHAQSLNNVLAEEIQGGHLDKNPYDTHEFERRRQPDAPLSNLGQSQALTLPSLPHFRAVRLADLAKHSRVRLFCSPMTRALQTAEVLSRTLGVKTIVRPDLCEHGGYYSGWGAEAKSAKGPTRVELQRAFPDYDFSECGEDGWWNTQSPGFEEKDHYHKRIARVVEWLRDLAWQHRNHHHAAMADADAIEARSVSSDASAAGLRASPSGQHLVDQPDYAVIISHGDFLNTLLVHLLRMPPDSGYVFSHNNTGVTHLEFSFETKDGEAQKDKMHVRMITMNAPPLEVVGARRSLI